MTVSAVNDETMPISGSLTTTISTISCLGLHEYLTFPNRSITLPAGGTSVETYTLSALDQWNGDFLVASTFTPSRTGHHLSAEDSVRGETRFTLLDGLDLRLTAIPSEIAAGTPVDVQLQVTNVLSTAISDLTVDMQFPSSSNLLSDTLTIPTLAAGATHTASWPIMLYEPGPDLISVRARSPYAGSDQAFASLHVLADAKLSLVVDEPVHASTHTLFDVHAQVRNTGDAAATSVQVGLALPDTLQTDMLTKTIGTLLAGGEERDISWTMTASAAGLYALRAQVQDASASTTLTAYQMVTVVGYSHTISLTTSHQTIVGHEPVTVTLTLSNTGDQTDEVRVETVSSHPQITFAVYDDGNHLTLPNPKGPVIVPAGGTKDISLVVTPHQWEIGDITITARSTLDPTATDQAHITVRESLQTVYLPMIQR